MIEPKKGNGRTLIQGTENVGTLERAGVEQLPSDFGGIPKLQGSAVAEGKSPNERMSEEAIEEVAEGTTEIMTQQDKLEKQTKELCNDDDSSTPRVLTKVDKAVSTNDTLEDLQRALTYEVIFTTLLEKKVMAIKRECEERKRAKRMKRKSIGRIFFSRKLFGGSRKLRGDSEPDVFMRGEFGAMMASPTGLRSIKTVKRSSGSGGRRDGDEIEVFSNSASASNGSHRSQFARATLTKAQKVKTQLTTAHGASVGQPADDSVASTLSNSSDKNDISGAGASGGQSMVRRSLLVRAQTHTPAEVMTSSSGSGDSRAATHRRSVSVINGNGNSNGNGGTGGLPVSLLERTYDTTSLASGYENGTGARLHTSTMADDSLTSLRDSIESLSFGSSRCTVSFGGAEIIPDETASLIYERARLAKRLRILEAKSISAQCSPVLPRHLIATIPAPPPEPMPLLAQTTVSIDNAMQAATTTKHIITPTTAVPYTAPPRAGAYTTVGSEITTVPTSNKITQTKQHIFRHQVSYTDSTYGGAGEFGDMSAYSRYISRQNTSEESANLTVSTLLNQSDSLSLHAPICSPTTTGDIGASGGGGGVGAFMLGDRFKSKSTSLLVVGGMGRNRLLPTPQIVNAPFVSATSANGGSAVSGTVPCNISHSDQLVDSFNTNKFTSSGYAAPVAPFNAQNQLPSHHTTTNGTATATTNTFSPATMVYQATMAAGVSEGTTTVVALNGSRVRNGNANGVIVVGTTVPADTAKLNRMTSTSTGSSVAPTGCCTTTKSSSRDREKDKQRYKPSWPSGQSGSDDEYRKRKRKYSKRLVILIFISLINL